MKVLIIGGAGLLGTAVEELLINAGHETLVFDNFTSNSVDRNDIKGKVISGNACTLSNMFTVFSSFRPDVVFNFVDSLYDKEGKYTLSQEIDTCVNTTTNIIRCIDKYRVKHVFFGSSCEVYKGGSKRSINEKSATGGYSYTGASKLASESILYLASLKYGFSFSSLRFFQTFGNRLVTNPKHDVTTFFIDSLLKDEGVVIAGPKTYIDILNLTEAASAAYIVFSKVLEGNDLGIVNIGSGEPVQLLELYSRLADITGREKRNYNYTAGRQSRSLVCCNKKIKSLGWTKTRSFEDEVKEVVKFRETIINA